MDVKLLHETAGLRTFAVVFSTGEEALEGLLAFARAHQVSGASLTAVGALQRVTFGFFEIERRDYKRISMDEQVEVLTMAGNIATTPEGPKLHAHLVVGRSDGQASGGHLLEAIVRPTLEVIVVETPARLRRRMDQATGLALLDVG